LSYVRINIKLSNLLPCRG